MTISVFPQLTQALSIKKTPQFMTHIQRAVSGRELRLTFKPVPTWLFTVRFDFLRDNSDQRQASQLGPSGWGTTSADLRTLMGFYLSVQGSFSPFYFNDYTDDTVVGQLIGTGDGSTTVFQMIRTMGTAPASFNEPVLAFNGTPIIYLNGTPFPSGGNWSISEPGGVLTFNSPPGSGVVITSDFNNLFYCRFAEDTQDFDYFLYQLWSIEGLKIQSLLL